MRIIGGKHRGRKLKTFDGTDVRPTSDRAREALFNILGGALSGTEFYDGFCGSGAVGIEALSRGATVVMTDLSDKSVRLTKENLALTGERAEVIKSDCVSYLKSTNKTFDVMFFDPPYASEVGLAALEVVSERSLLKDGGVVVYETDKEVIKEFSRLTFLRSRKYGKAYFNFYGKKI